MRAPSLLAAVLVAGVVGATTGLAQTEKSYPARPVRLVVPFSAGAGVDVLSRIVSQKLAESWGQSVVIENRTGGGGRLGASLVAKAPADGHTLLWTSSAFTISAALFSDLPYDPLKDFAGISCIGIGTGAIVVSPTLGPKTAQEFIAYAQARPGKILLGSAGAGSATHMSGERFRLGAGLHLSLPPSVLDRVETLTWRGLSYRAGPPELAFIPKLLAYARRPNAVPSRHVEDLRRLAPLVDRAFLVELAQFRGLRFLGHPLPRWVDPFSSLADLARIGREIQALGLAAELDAFDGSRHG